MENVHLTESLMRLSYNIRAAQEKKEQELGKQIAAEACMESAATEE